MPEVQRKEGERLVLIAGPVLCCRERKKLERGGGNGTRGYGVVKAKQRERKGRLRSVLSS